MFTVMRDKKEYTYSNLRDFSNEHRIRIGMAADLVSGRIKEVGGFTLYTGEEEEVYELPSTFELEDMDGNIFTVSDVDAFSSEFKVQKDRIVDLVTGKSLFHKGFFLKGNTSVKELVLNTKQSAPQSRHKRF